MYVLFLHTCIYNPLIVLWVFTVADFPLWQLLSRSLTTLNTLSLSTHLFEDYGNDHLWRMYFPHLRSFTLAFSDYEAFSGEKDALDFILAHSNTIEVLDLEYVGYDDD